VAAVAACRRTPEVRLPEWQHEIFRKPAQWLRDPDVRLLRDYLRVDTTNPPGRERRGAEFLKAYLDCEGIPSEIVCETGDRCGLYARLRGRDHERAILLLNHIDVVPAYRPYWHHDPFGGAIERGYVYGRGAYDMKSIGIAQLLAFVGLAKSGLEPDRDVVYFAEWGEEAPGPNGVAWVFARRPELFSGVNLVLNEGGYEEVVAGDLRFWGIEIAQGGYGSALLYADDRRALVHPAPFERLGLFVPPGPAVRAYFDAVADFRAPFFANAFRHPELLEDPDVLKWIPYQNVTLVTGGVSYAPPFDARLLPAYDHGRRWDAPVTLSVPLGVDPRPYLDRVIEEAKRRGASVTGITSGPPGKASPYPTSDTRAIGRALEALHPGIPIVPFVASFAMTDSVGFRARGIPVYGFSPFLVDPVDAARRHGNDERIFLPFYTRGVRAMSEVLFELAAEPRQK
jgi:acetylornithine deacetylase/succinyl-diaminopimelate desuccinylase-like protein